MKYGLPEKTVQEIRSVFARYPQVEKAILYGSRAKGNHKIGSDVDLVLLGGDGLDLPVLYKIMEDIDDLLLPYTFDLSIYAAIDDTDVIDHIRRVGVTFYKKQEDGESLPPCPTFKEIPASRQRPGHQSDDKKVGR